MTRPQDTTPANPAQVTERTLSGETVNGIPVLAYMWEEELPGGDTAQSVAYHWSTPPSYAKNVIKLADVAALTAAIGAGGQAVAVKPLEWEERTGARYADTAFGEACVDVDGDGFYVIESGRKHSAFASVEAAQAFVQKHHDIWVKDWLEPSALAASHMPVGDGDYFSLLVERARQAAEKASAKFPQPNYIALKIAEEAGEVVRGAVHYAENRMEWIEVEGEIVQLLAMIIRFVTEGDLVNGIVPPLAASTGEANHG